MALEWPAEVVQGSKDGTHECLHSGFQLGSFHQVPEDVRPGNAYLETKEDLGLVSQLIFGSAVIRGFFSLYSVVCPRCQQGTAKRLEIDSEVAREQPMVWS